MKIQEGCDRYCAYCVIPDGARAGALHAAWRRWRPRRRRLATRAIGRSCSPASIWPATAGAWAMRCSTRSRGCTIRRTSPGYAWAPWSRGSSTGLGWSGFGAGPGVRPSSICRCSRAARGVLQAHGRRYSRGLPRRLRTLLRWPTGHCAVTTDVLVGFPGETEAEALPRRWTSCGRCGSPASTCSPIPTGSAPRPTHGRDRCPRRSSSVAAADSSRLGTNWKPHTSQGLGGQRCSRCCSSTGRRKMAGRGLHPPIRSGTAPGAAAGA